MRRPLRFGRADDVADAADGFDEIARGAEFLADAFDVSVEGAAVDFLVVAPDGLEDVVAVERFVISLAEVEEEAEFGGGDVGWFAVEVEFDGVFIEAEILELEIDGAGGVGGALEDGGDAEHELFGAEGFGHVVVGSEFEAGDAVFGLGAGGEHDDGGFVGAAISFELFEDGDAVFAREHEIEDDEIGDFLEGGDDAVGAVEGFEGFVALALEVEGDEFGDVFFVFDDEDFGHNW